MIISEKKTEVDGPEAMAKILAEILSSEHETDRDKEHFWVCGLHGRNQLHFIELVSLGAADQCIAHPREVFRYAISRAAITLVVAHNHPSGGVKPSREDINTTRRLAEAGDILGIPILDHLIINNKGEYFSFGQNSIL